MIHAIISQNDSVQILSFQKGSCVTNVQVKDENVFLQTPRFSCVLVWLVLQFAEMCMGWRLVCLVRFFCLTKLVVKFAHAQPSHVLIM